MMYRNGPARRAETECDGAADALPGSGHKRGAGLKKSCRHGVQVTASPRGASMISV